MGGVNIQDDVIIDKSIRRSLDSRASVVKRYVADIGKSWPVLIVCGGLVPLFQSRCLAASYSAFCCCHAMDNRCPFQHAFNIGADSCLWSRHSDDFYLSYSYPHFSCHHPPYAAAKVIGEVATVITGSVASYYWAGGEASPEIPFLPVFASMKRLAR
ncbi:hypothetical protein YC2023_012504 [Brassica napus]